MHHPSPIPVTPIGLNVGGGTLNPTPYRSKDVHPSVGSNDQWPPTKIETPQTPPHPPPVYFTDLLVDGNTYFTPSIPFLPPKDYATAEKYFSLISFKLSNFNSTNVPCLIPSSGL